MSVSNIRFSPRVAAILANYPEQDRDAVYIGRVRNQLIIHVAGYECAAVNEFLMSYKNVEVCEQLSCITVACLPEEREHYMLAHSSGIVWDAIF